MQQRKYLTSFARRLTRPLSPNKKNLLEGYLPTISITPESNLEDISKGFKEIAMEIGFGNGEHLLAQAIANPDTLFIGCEPYLNGVTSLLGKLKENKIENVRIYTDDARVLLESFPDKALDTVYILCPDPWPKARHNKRRIVNIQTLKMLSAKCSGKIVLATDHQDYAEWMLEHIIESELFKYKSDNLGDYTELPKDWLYTKYQRRGLDLGSKIYYFNLRIQ